jgi:hypothetical protein
VLARERFRLGFACGTHERAQIEVI